MSSLRDHLTTAQRLTLEFFEDQWFDRTRRVRTSGEVSLERAGLAQAVDSEAYQPARPAHIREALRSLCLQDASSYTYVDLGSGKGRTLFIAAEQPFREIIGVELTPVLHAEACRNEKTFRQRRNGCHRIRPVHGNAMHLEFPAGPLVLYMFNPFGVVTVREVLRNLYRSLEEQRRHVIVVLLWPRWASEVAAMPGMELRRSTPQYRIYEAFAEQS